VKKKKNYDEIHALARKLVLLKEQAKKQGVFVEDRELLTCPKCGLEEDVACQGLLIVYYPSNAGSDTGLRFQEVNSGTNRFRCPACCAEFNAPEREEMECRLKLIANKFRRVAV